jgi:hypothetical protein
LHHPKLLPAQNSRFQACFSKAVRQISEALKGKISAAISRAEKPGPVRKCGQSPMDTAREAELVPIFYREPSREHSTRSLALSALGRCMGMAGSLARAVRLPMFAARFFCRTYVSDRDTDNFFFVRACLKLL